MSEGNLDPREQTRAEPVAAANAQPTDAASVVPERHVPASWEGDILNRRFGLAAIRAAEDGTATGRFYLSGEAKPRRSVRRELVGWEVVEEEDGEAKEWPLQAKPLRCLKYLSDEARAKVPPDAVQHKEFTYTDQSVQLACSGMNFEPLADIAPSKGVISTTAPRRSRITDRILRGPQRSSAMEHILNHYSSVSGTRLGEISARLPGGIDFKLS